MRVAAISVLVLVASVRLVVAEPVGELSLKGFVGPAPVFRILELKDS